jgi:hypothetical protein
MSFYNYIIGRLYSWGLKRADDTPITNVVITMCIVHYFQIFTMYMIFRKVFDFPDFALGKNKLYVGLLLIVFCIIYYFIFFDRGKWELYAQQVEKEEKRTRIRKKFFVLLYLIGSILIFFISLPIVFGH